MKLPATVCVKDPAVKLFARLMLPAMVNAPVAVFIPAPLKVTFWKLPAPILAATAPLKSIVEPVAVKVPVFVQSPLTVCVNALE